MVCNQCGKTTEEKEPYGWCQENAYGVHDSAAVIFTTYRCGDCRRANAELQTILQEIFKILDKEKE